MTIFRIFQYYVYIDMTNVILLY